MSIQDIAHKPTRLIGEQLEGLVGVKIKSVDWFNHGYLDSGFIITFENGVRLTAQDGEYGDNAFRFLIPLVSGK